MTQETFSLGAIHIDETAAFGEPEAMAQQRTQEVRSTVAGVDASMPFHSALLEDALPSDSEVEEASSTTEQRRQLQELLMVNPSCCPPMYPCAAWRCELCNIISKAEAII